MKIGLIAFTAAGDGLAEKLQGPAGAAGLKASCYRCRAGLLHDWTRRHFASDDAPRVHRGDKHCSAGCRPRI